MRGGSRQTLSKLLTLHINISLDLCFRMSSNNIYYPQASTTVTAINRTTISANSTPPQMSTTVTPSIRIVVPPNSVVLRNVTGNINEEASTHEGRNAILKTIGGQDIPETCVSTAASD